MALVTCPDCGHEVSTEAPVCPNCGRPWPGRQEGASSSAQPARPPGYNGLAITSFVLGVVGLLSFWPLGIGAVIFGPRALSQIKRQRAQGDPEQQGRALAIAGIVIGTIAIVLTVVLIVLWIVMFVSISSGDRTWAD